ncbi:MAG: type II secretion system protein GspD [Verrucomicrobiae bacterium]|nr:type II secretion system protein GspD [Verrucomicrobiae bacterium]MCP5533342.1 type II secretion system protein GspD [Akkermansiaceae bacterium]MCP5543185.1 type II secretion system protein GspD [Akkermansiaceae bacterium]MCP5546333.1 type II secretion system protein GspD [Akkermansiaceae bacterium]
MKSLTLLSFSAVLLATGGLRAQNPDDAPDKADWSLASPMLTPVAPNEAPAPEPDLGNPSDLPPPADLPAAPGGDLPSLPTGGGGGDGSAPITADGTPAEPFGPLEEQKQEMQKSEEGFIIKDAALNDIFQYLAKSAGRQYFHNAKIAGPDYLVTGHLNDGNPLQQMEELAFMYGLSLHTKGNTIYALTEAQLSQLPSSEFHYQLRYLRPTDINDIKELIKPILSPGTGIVNFEPKTNTVVIIDSAHRIEKARELLHGIDRAKGQIIVETKILRVTSNAAERVGVNWSSSLGTDGTPLSIVRDLNSVFGLPSSDRSQIIGADGTNLVLSPAQLNGVLRALAEGGIANQISNPTLITEDNEQAIISIIDRVPIITTTTTQATTGGNPTVTEEVRYKIDAGDKGIDSEDPTDHREIGISMVVTPTLLPDGTVRMKMRPRSAQIVDQVTSLTGNKYPRVSESMIETLARIPDGHSLVVGGFYGESDSRDRNKIPLLGDVPVLNFFFKSKESVKERASLVFIVTPKSYNPANSGANSMASNRLRSQTVIDCDYNEIDPDNPGPAHEPNLRRSIRGLQPTEAPYYPREGETSMFSKPSSTKSSGPRFSRARR